MSEEVQEQDSNIAKLLDLSGRIGPYLSTVQTLLNDCYSQLNITEEYLYSLDEKKLEQLAKLLLDIDMLCFNLWHIVSKTHLAVGWVKSARDEAKRVPIPNEILKKIEVSTNPMDNMVNAVASAPNAQKLIELLKARLENKSG